MRYSFNLSYSGLGSSAQKHVTYTAQFSVLLLVLFYSYNSPNKMCGVLFLSSDEAQRGKVICPGTSSLSVLG